MKTQIKQALSLFIGAALLFPVLAVGALQVSDTAGTWRVINFSMPSRLTLQQDSQGVVTGINESDRFDSSTGSITVSSNGAFSGMVPDPITGQVALGAQGELIINATSEDGPQSLTFHINQTADFMTMAGTSEDEAELILGLRAPQSMQPADLAGNWNVIGFQTPHHLVLERNAANQVIDIRGLDNFGTLTGTMTINSDASMSGQIDGSFTGTVNSTANGLVDVTVNTDDGVLSLTLFVNAAKDTMALLQSSFGTNDNFQEIMLFQKAPTNNVTSQLADHWRIVTFDAPAVTQVKDGQGRVTGLGGSTSFNAERQSLVCGYDGFFIARVGNTATGTFTPVSSGHVTVDVQIPGEGSETFGFQLNSSQTLLSSARYIGDGHELLIVTRSAPVPGNRDFGLVSFPDAAGLTVLWAAASTNTALQVSTNLTDWDTLPATVGQHSYTASGPASASFFRVIQPLP